MDDKVPLKYWLQSINLFQYYDNFCDHGILTKEQCQSLNDSQLSSIGISSPSHRDRILNHLPANEFWMDETSPTSPPPFLPEKTKNVRDSFLYKDNYQINAITLNNDEDTNTVRPTPAPRPVPRPRTKVQNSTKPKPVPRQRQRISKSNLNDSGELQTDSLKDRGSSENNKLKIDILGACTGDTSTDIAKNKPEGDPVVKSNDRLQDDDSVNLTCTSKDVDRSTAGKADQNPDKSRHNSGDYFNVNSMNELITESQPFEQPCESNFCNRDTTFENVEYDHELHIFKVKEDLAPDIIPPIYEAAADLSQKESTSFTAIKDQDTKFESVFRSPSPIEVVPSEGKDEDEDSQLYEPIWVEPRRRPADPKASELSPTKDNADFSSSQKNWRLSQLQNSNRYSTSFDMPPPSFPPPPLPEDQQNNVLQDFDPLAEEEQLPPLPERPAPTTKNIPFQVYENVHKFALSGQSATLPSDQNLEPDILSPNFLGTHQNTRPVSNDPFQHVDPFAEVHLDYEDLAETNPTSCGNNSSESSTFGTVLSFSPKTSSEAPSDAIYEMAADPDFDPFGLKSGAQLPRSVSSGSSGSGHRLDLVPPAPVWYEQVPVRSSVYSVAREDGDSSSNGSVEDLLERYTDDVESSTMSPVELLPPTALSARKKERSGYLFKQGGVKQNRGWRKRWVIFDGKSLRYYSSSKDQVSKRIVPLSCMKNVEMDVKPNNSRQFKFKLYCTNRVFLFATDNLDDCKMWSSTLMEAILTYKKPDGGEVPGGDMAGPDMADWIKLDKNRLKFYVVLKKHKFCYYQNEEDYRMASPLHEIDMKLASIKEIERTKLQLSTHYCTFILHFESSSDASNWKMAIEESITDALGDNSVLDQVKENIDNCKCADCGANDANWASMNLGIVLCLKCAGIHRGFDHRLSKIRSLRMDTKVWNSSLIEMFKEIGNRNANKFWLGRLLTGSSLSPGDSLDKRKSFIHKKYREKLYCDVHPQANNQKLLNEALLEAAQTDNVLLTMQILLSGADVLYMRPNNPNSTAFDLAKAARQRIQMEFLLQNGGDSLKDQYHNQRAKEISPQHSCKSIPWQAQLCPSYFIKTCPIIAAIEKCVHEVKVEIVQATKERKGSTQLHQTESQNFMPGSEEVSLVASLRAAIQHQGTLQKTGSSMKDFLKRWCILEHGHLSYFVNEESKVEKDRIDNDTILCIQSTSNDKQHPYCFEISSRRNNRTYLFSAATQQEQQQWLTKISQVFCPVHLIEPMKNKTISLAGYAFMKTGINSNWQRSWFVLEDRKLYFTDKEQEERVEDSVDLRKVKSITKIHESISTCEACLERGHLFALSGVDRTLYFQADLVKDTDRIFSAFETAVKKGGDVLEDQVLQPDDCPVFVTKCINYIEQNGLLLRGIYREAAQDSRVQALLDEFKEDARAVVLRQDDNRVHEVCNALKRYLRKLKDPLLTSRLYRRWVQTATDCDHNSKLQWYKYLLNQLPRINYNTMKCLACHLNKLSKNSSKNLMTLDNISIAFGSTLMQADNGDGGINNPAMVGSQMQLEMKVITDIVTYCDWLFDVQQSDENRDLEDKLRDAERRLREINTEGPIKQNDLMIWVHYKDPKGSFESVKINEQTTVSDVVLTLISKMKLGIHQWSLHEVVKEELDRPLHPEMKVWPVINEWRNWTEDYSAKVCLCIKTNELKDKLQEAYDPSRALFAETKYAEKKKFIKTAFEFTQAKLSYYKDTKNLGNPVCSWNIEDLAIYKGYDSKRPPPSGSKWLFTFLCRGEKVGGKDLPHFGRAVCCSSEQDLYLWIAAMLKSQHSSWFS